MVFITSISEKAINKTEIEHKEFCIYASNSMIKMVDPYYTNSNNKLIYFDSIDKYARYIGTDWFGVFYCGNNTLINNIGEYFEVVENPNLVKRDTEKSNLPNKEQENKKEAKEVEDEKKN